MAPDLDDDSLEADARALASVLRIRILRLCLDEPRTNKEIADRLGRDPATTLHHVRTLARRGFLAAQPPRRGARGAREVPYLATRKSWRVPQVPGQAHVLIGAFLEEVAEAPPESVATARLGLRMDDAGWTEFRERVDALLEEFAARPPDPQGTAYSVFVAYHEDVARRPDAPAPPGVPTSPGVRASPTAVRTAPDLEAPPGPPNEPGAQ